MTARTLSLVIVICVALCAFGCSQFAEKSQPQVKSEPKVERPAVLLDRYELREVRNGPVSTTALLDKQTGRVWLMSKDRKGEQGFLETTVFPKPEFATPKEQVLHEWQEKGAIEKKQERGVK